MAGRRLNSERKIPTATPFTQVAILACVLNIYLTTRPENVGLLFWRQRYTRNESSAYKISPACWLHSHLPAIGIYFELQFSNVPFRQQGCEVRLRRFLYLFVGGRFIHCLPQSDGRFMSLLCSAIRAAITFIHGSAPGTFEPCSKATRAASGSWRST